MSILCSLFGHRMVDAFLFSEDGMVRSVCSRSCGHFYETEIPPQHQHNYGPKFRRKIDGKNVWYWACPCGHVETAPVPIPRKKKGI